MKKIQILLVSMLLLLSLYIPTHSTQAATNFCDQYKGVTKIWWDGMELKAGQIGRLNVEKDTPLFKLDGENKVFSRTLKAGEFYRIYAFKPGMLSLGGGYYVDRDTRVTYQTPSKAKLDAVKCLNGTYDTPVVAHFIDVGQGDSILIKLSNGKTILVDGGKQGDDVLAYLSKIGVKQIDLMIATHPDADHISGLVDVLKTLPVKQVLDSGKEHTTQTYMNYLTQISLKKIPFSVAKVGQSIALDSNVKITVLNSGEGHNDNNEASVAIKLTYGNMDLLLTGDAEAEQEEMMRTRFNLEAEVYKASHHGSNTGNSLAFLQEVKPQATVLSYGKDNSYGHPHKEVTNRLTSLGSKLYSTADSGNIVVTLTKTAFSITAKPMVTTTPVTSGVTLSKVDLAGETATLTNTSSSDVSLTGWKLVSVEGNQTYNFPSGFTLKAGASVTVTSGPNAKESKPTYLKWTNSNIWNNSGDAAELYNATGVKVSEIR